ncbi:hypothetical protein ACP4OV_024851 [Aristida adscensionis]
MAYCRSYLARRRRCVATSPSLLPLLLRPFASSPSPSTPPSSASPASASKPPALSARLSFVFDQLDALDRSRSSELSARDASLRRIQSWRRPAPQPDVPPPEAEPGPGPGREADVPKKEAEAVAVAVAAEGFERMSMEEVLRREVELVHPWPEWIELMERLAQQRYFDLGRAGAVDETSMAAAVPMDLSEVSEEVGIDFSRDWNTVKNACMNFGRDRFDILRSLPRKDLQILVGHGCPSMDPKVVFSAKLIRKLVHLDEGDLSNVCSSCNLRGVCSRGYILTRKEDEARTLDVIRILLTYGFHHVKETVENKPLLQLKPVKTVVRKLIHEIVKLSAVPIDPNLPPPIIRKPPPKVKQPPPPPKKRVGRDDVDMKKGDWLCPKCDFMNFAKNTVCLQCDAKRPKRQLLPGEWECPRCNFLNYRRNMSCFHCEHDRPPDEYTNGQMEAKHSAPRKRLERPRKADVSSAWNFDFDDNESDGADVAAFEFADSSKERSVDTMSYRDAARSSEDAEFRMADTTDTGRENKFSERESLSSSRAGFDDFDDEDDIDSYELDFSKGNQTGGVSRMSYSDLDSASDSDGFDEFSNGRSSSHGTKDDITVSADEDEFEECPSLRSSHLADSWHKTRGWSGSNKCDDFGYKRTRAQGDPDRASSRALAYSDDEPLPDDLGSNTVDRFQYRRTNSSTNTRDNFQGGSRNLNGRRSSGDRYGRMKLNERSSSVDRHHGGPFLDRRQGIRGNRLDNSSRRLNRNVRNWDRNGDFDDMHSGVKRI